MVLLLVDNYPSFKFKSMVLSIPIQCEWQEEEAKIDDFNFMIFPSQLFNLIF